MTSPLESVGQTGVADGRAGLVALLFTDIEGSSLRWLNHRSAMQQALREHDAILREAIATHGGEVFKTGGDAFHAVFPRPAEAVGAAVAAQRALAARDWSAVDGLAVRMAVHVGSAHRREGDLFGPALNRAARLIELGHGGQILLTSSVAELIGAERESGHALRYLGSTGLDDPSQPVGVYQVEVEGLPQSFPPLELHDTRPTNLPRRLAPLIGRDTDTKRLLAMFDRSQLITLTGAGGVGKTRLLLTAGERMLGRFRDGVWLVELAALTDAALVAGAVSSVLGIGASSERTPLDALLGRLRQQQLLLLIDNCEHLVESVAGLVEAVLAACPKVAVLATSQEPLAIAGEQVLRLPSLRLPDHDQVTPEQALEAGAVRLFVERAKAVDPDFALDARSTPTVVSMCRRLDGIPLAIEMAAARAPLLGLDVLAEKLDERFRVLAGGRRTALPRHQTLRATLDWSYGLLSEGERIVLRRAAIFAGGFTLEAASAVIADASVDAFDVIDCLSHLVARSLVDVYAGGSGTRYRLLETTRAYALEALAAAGETDQLERRHAAHFHALFARAERERLERSDHAWRGVYLPELDNLRAAIDRTLGSGADPAVGVALVCAAPRMSPYMSVVEARRHTALGQAYVHSVAPQIASRYWFADARAWTNADSNRSVRSYERALETYGPLNEDWLGVELACSLAAKYGEVGRCDEADGLLERVSALVDRAPARLQGDFHHALAITASVRGESARGLTHFDAAIECFRAAGADRQVLVALMNRADTLWTEQRLDEAVADFRATVLHFRQSNVHRREEVGWVLMNLAGTLVELGDAEGATAPLREGLTLCRDEGSEWMFVDHAARWLLVQGRAEAAARLIGYGDATQRRYEDLRQPNEERAHAWTLARLEAQLPPARLAALMAEGARLSGDEACRLALEA